MNSPMQGIPDPDLTNVSVLNPGVGRDERWAHGKSLRDQVPHEALAYWRADDTRPDPVDMVIESHEGRNPDLIGLRMARMAATPYGFLRGAANISARDAASLPATGIQPVICGDMHLSNIGFYRTQEGALVLDLNDFDEAHTGGWEWDVRRLVASVWIAGLENGASEDTCAEAVMSCVNAYRDRIRSLARQPLLTRAFNRLDVDELQATASEALAPELDRTIRKATKHTSDRKLPKVTAEEQGTRRIIEDPPLLTRLREGDAQELGLALDRYLQTIPPAWRRVLDGYTLVDVAHKVVGIGSVGLGAYIALLEGSGPDDVLFLQLKEAQRSVIAPYVHGDKAWHRHQGKRVVEYQQTVQTASDPLLGWTDALGQQLYVRQWRNLKGTIDLTRVTGQALADYSRIAGDLLARGHSRTSGASMIAGYVGKHDSVAEAFTRFAKAYADQTLADHEALLAAIKQGRLPVDEGHLEALHGG